PRPTASPYTTLFRSLAEGVQRIFHPVQQRRQGDVAQVVRRQRREQVQAHVGRRGAVGHLRLGVLLVVVGRQPVVLGVDEGLEEQPRLARQPAQRAAVLGGERHVVQLAREADQVRDQRRQQPGEQQRRGRPQRLGPHEGDQRGRQRGEERRGP